MEPGYLGEPKFQKVVRSWFSFDIFCINMYLSNICSEISFFTFHFLHFTFQAKSVSRRILPYKTMLQGHSVPACLEAANYSCHSLALYLLTDSGILRQKLRTLEAAEAISSDNSAAVGGSSQEGWSRWYLAHLMAGYIARDGSMGGCECGTDGPRCLSPDYVQ